jgi:roadblock/LC7 domain-containing protein
MTDLANLLEINGVVAALRFLDDGTLSEAVGAIDALHSGLAAELCHANGRIMHQGSDVLANISGMPGWPPRGWMMIGDGLSVCAIANVVCFVNNGEASFNETLIRLSELERQ